MKTCSKCGETKPLSEFYKSGKNNSKAAGQKYRSDCKDCCRGPAQKRYKKYYKKNKDKVIEKGKKYYKDNGDARREYQRDYYGKNREKEIKKVRDWQERKKREEQ